MTKISTALPEELKKPCHWCGKKSTGTAIKRIPTPAGWGTMLGGRYASCGSCGEGWIIWTPVDKN